MNREKDPETGRFLKGPPKPPKVAKPREGWKAGRPRKSGVWVRQVKRVYAALDEEGLRHLHVVQASLGDGASEGDAVRRALEVTADEIEEHRARIERATS